MTIALTGGGSGGHITPLLVVASEIKKKNPDIKLIYIGQTGDSLADIPAKDKNIDKVYTVRAGKFRRYHSEGIRQLLDISTMLKNIRDVFLVAIGLVQSYFLLRKVKPAVIFSRGGFVSVPVCLGAKLSGISYITHDSDPLPSLTNKIIGRWATQQFVALSKELYPYPAEKTVTTGIPVDQNFKPLTEESRREYRQKLNIGKDDQAVFVIGGGLGAKSLNDAVQAIMPDILAEFDNLQVLHVTGRGKYTQVLEQYDKSLISGQRNRIKVLDFVQKVYEYSGASDVVITRAGATNLAEFENQGVACIVVPSTFLVGGHQLQNAKYLKDKDAAVVITDKELVTNPKILAKELSVLLEDSDERKRLAKNILTLAHPNAGEDLATLIIKAAES